MRFKIFEKLLLLKNRRRDVISLNQPRGMSEKMAANGIRTYARTNQMLIVDTATRIIFD